MPNDLLDYAEDVMNIQGRLIGELEANLRGKDNEIQDLKTRIKYLKKFAPDETEPWVTKG